MGRYEEAAAYLKFLIEYLSDSDKELLKTLTEEEFAVFLGILYEYKHQGKSKEFERIKGVDYVRIPVSVEEFLTNDYYLGKVGRGLYPKLLQDMKRIFEDPSIVEVILSGSIGWGKSFFSQLFAMYQLYLISCMRNPQEWLGIGFNSPIVFCNLSVTGDKSTEFFKNLRVYIDTSPYFEEHFPRVKKVNSALIFPNQVTYISAGGTEGGVIGSNIIFAILDELNFMSRIKKSVRKKPGQDEYNQALQLYDSIMRRLKSRFMFHGRAEGKVILISSKKYPNDFLETHIKDSEGKPGVIVLSYATWDVKRASAFSGKWFHVYIGDGFTKPRILEPEEVSKYPEDHVKAVPEEYRIEFERNLLDALRDIAGIAILGSSLFIPDTDRVAAIFDETRPLPCTILETNFKDGFSLIVENLFDVDGEGKVIKPKHYPEANRFIHIDLSKNTDKTGIAMGCFSGYKGVDRVNKGTGEAYIENVPKVHIDIVLSVTSDPDLGEVSQNSIVSFVKDLKELGFRINRVSSDTYQNLMLKQTLTLAGFNTAELSIDRSPEAVVYMKNNIMTETLSCHKSPLAKMEIASLEKNKMTGKIDHPESGSKDLSDAIAGVCHHVATLHHYQEDILPTVSQIRNDIFVGSPKEKIMDAEFVRADYSQLSEEERFMRQSYFG